jgi:hypothetical protein
MIYEESLVLWRELGRNWGIAEALINLGNMDLVRSDYDAAHQHYAESLTLDWEIARRKPCLVYAFGGLAAVKLGTDHTPDTAQVAARLAAISETLLLSTDFIREPIERKIYDDAVNAARMQLGEEAFNAAWAEGEKMTLEEAIELALQDSS